VVSGTGQEIGRNWFWRSSGNVHMPQAAICVVYRPGRMERFRLVVRGRRWIFSEENDGGWGGQRGVGD
jgi:hypothetical protein